ncbi:MAG TPA: HIT family protein [Actinomycetota bacterium]|nr:HIT family protein [Actinomycetota bacterium]
MIYEDADHIVFLNRFPTVPGYVLLAPREHRINVTGDFTVEEYLATQRLLHSVAEAVRTELGAERVYILSLGSHQGNAHVHWHVAPLPPGTPYDKQQFEALRAENGILCIPDQEMKEFADRLRLRLAGCT